MTNEKLFSYLGAMILISFFTLLLSLGLGLGGNLQSTETRLETKIIELSMKQTMDNGELTQRMLQVENNILDRITKGQFQIDVTQLGPEERMHFMSVLVNTPFPGQQQEVIVEEKPEGEEK